MPTTEHYRKLISEIPFGVERKVFQMLCLHVGEENAISLRDLAVLAFGHPTKYHLMHRTRCSMSIFATIKFYVRAFFIRRDMRRLEEMRRRLFDV